MGNEYRFHKKHPKSTGSKGKSPSRRDYWGDLKKSSVFDKKHNKIFCGNFQFDVIKTENPLPKSRRISIEMVQAKPCAIYLGECREAILLLRRKIRMGEINRRNFLKASMLGAAAAAVASAS
ncbi:MAG: twin-arginine translocation signal domain-containing protein, partial [Desulfitobacterium sp.]